MRWGRKRSRTGQEGFTLVELLIVIAIIGALALIAIPNFRAVTSKANDAKCRANLQALETAWEAYIAGEKGGVAEAVADVSVLNAYLKRTPKCPSGGTYSVDANGVAQCTVHGTLDNFKPSP